jgi:hypothetical protein
MLSEMIEEELNDAEKYINHAINHKEENSSLADTFYKLSVEEMGHANTLHDQVVKIILDYRKEHGDPPEKMQWVYDYLHKKHIEHANKIKVLQASYKG